MSETLDETDFDYIVLGTGFNESVLAGAFARAGKKVLHFDSQKNYGSNWSVFGFKEAAQWYFNGDKKLNESAQPGTLIFDNNISETNGVALIDMLKVEYEKQYASNFRFVDFKVYPTLLSKEESETIRANCAEGTLTKETLISSAHSTEKRLLEKYSETLDGQDPYDVVCQMTTFDKLLKASRSYNIDTAPKLLNSREELVEVLIRSGVGRYLEFKSVDDLYIFDKAIKKLEKVPGSKEDVFTSKSISLIEKRKLMRFLTFAMEYKNGDTEVEEDIPYSKFLEEKFKISGKLLEAIIYAIALVDQNASTKHGLDSTHKFVKSMGRFGRGSYLCALYGGAGEVAQAFCRVCAVYGGIYVLNTPIDRIMVDSETNECTGIVTKEGSEYKCKVLVSGVDYLPLSCLPNEGDFGSWVSRAVVVTDHPLKDAETCDALAYSVFPSDSDAGNSECPIYIIHQSQESMACPKNQYVTYLWTASRSEGALENALNILLKKNEGNTDEQSIKCIFKMLYDQRIRSVNDLENSAKIPKCIAPCSDPDVSLDFQNSMKEVIEFFYKFEGKDAEFMPAAENDPNDEYQ
ncbi:hypothetical protein G6F56_000122 [Rhizopus delemar]|nr:hypothetical protein G6F56_000122 [Rhizopus delemar]